MERLKRMKENLVDLVSAQVGGNLHEVDGKELGEAIDMIKDLSEAMYYCSVVEAMEDTKKEKQSGGHNQMMMYHTPVAPYYPEYFRDMDRDFGRMYYNGGGSSSSSSGNNSSSGGNNARGGGTRGYTDYEMMKYNQDYDMRAYPIEIRDSREGRSPLSRKSYMEAKELHHDKATQIKELDKYLQELTQDITEMIHGASPEEKTMLQQKISTLATKIK